MDERRKKEKIDRVNAEEEEEATTNVKQKIAQSH